MGVLGTLFANKATYYKNIDSKIEYLREHKMSAFHRVKCCWDSLQLLIFEDPPLRIFEGGERNNESAHKHHQNISWYYL